MVWWWEQAGEGSRIVGGCLGEMVFGIGGKR